MKKIGLFLLVLSASVVFAKVDSQWRGPARDGIYPGETLQKSWSVTGPKRLWSTLDVGEGFSSPSVTADRVYVTGMIDGTGYLFAFDLSGKLLWKAGYGAEWTENYPGARCTPTVVDDLIYIESATGTVFCFSTAGKQIWSKDMYQEFQAEALRWGLTESLLVDGDRVFCSPGGKFVTVAALDRFSGKTLWKIKADGNASSYCSPKVVEHGKRRILVTMTAKSVIGIDADTGVFLWSQPHITDWDVNPNTPLYKDGFLYTLSGYGTGGQMFKLSPDGAKIEKVWAQNILDSQFGACVLLDGYIYGSGQNNRGWHCVNWKTGKVQYSEKTIGNKGNIIFADGLFVCYGERGDVALVNATPEAFKVISTFKMSDGSGQHWAHPVIRDGRLYVRHGEALNVYDISGK